MCAQVVHGEAATAWADVPGLSFTVPGMTGQKLLLRASGGIVNANSGGDKTGGVRCVRATHPPHHTTAYLKPRRVAGLLL